ncbi:hypothetical protein R1sor_007253 [Riccia sorocarpa]|uniref:FCP1 homology domain-containing protein n=1 Tax=Riccia sorocarpa TaxID=122646 RepID=A0ABD3HPW2_9MARC
MGRKSHKEVIFFVCCSDSTFSEFEKFVVRWKKGEIPDVHGVVGPVENERGIKVDRDFSQLSVNRFRPVNGLLDSDLRLVWTQLEKGIVWVSRPAKLPESAKLPGSEPSVSLKDYCKMLKRKRALALRILRYLGSQDYQPSLKDSVQMRPYSMEYQPKGAGEDFVEEKGTATIQTNIKIKAPQWGFVGMASPDGSAHVHPVCKRRGFCNMMLSNFSSEGSTVLDFFSGGVFAREALMLQRDVIYFANSQEEAEFIVKYGKSLVSYSERVRHWFAKYKSAKKPASTIKQPAILAMEHANTHDDHIPAYQKEKAPFVYDEVLETDALARLDGEPEDVDNVHSNNPRGLDPAEHIIKKQDSNDQGSLYQAVQQRNVEEHEEEGPLVLALNYCRSLGSSHSDDLETVPLVQSREPSVQPNVPIIPSQTLELNENDPGLEDLILEHVEHADDSISSGQQHDVQMPRNTSGPLALIQMSICPAPDFMQMDNPLVKPLDLLPRKLLILDVEGLLLYVEGFMDRTSKTAAGDVVGAKKVIRKNGVQEFITRCFELFDIAFWMCSDRNLLYDYTYYLFSGEQYGKFLFRWDQGKALDTNERWTRNHREIRLLLKPLKTVWETFPDFNARNTLLVDVNPYRASANPEDTGIFPVQYTGSYTDQYLTTVLLLYLEGLSQAFDIREYVREHVLQGSQRPLHFRATSRGLPGLLHKYSSQAIETFVPTLLTKRGNLTDFEKSVLSRLPDIDELEDHDCIAWARLLGLSWNQALQDDLTTIGVSDEKHTMTKASVKYARDFLVEVKNVHLA